MASKEIKCMRTMAWERVKGELYSILQTYDPYDSAGNYDRYEDTKYDRMKEETTSFILRIEGEGWQE
jgi:hypothetical protein